MKIDLRSLYSEVSVFIETLKESELRKLEAGAEELLGNMWDLPLWEFFRFCENDFTSRIDVSKPLSVADIFYVRRFGHFTEELAKVIDTMKLPNEDGGAVAGELKISPSEGMLVFVRHYFGCHNFQEASKIPISDYVIARRDKHNEAVRARAMIKKQQIKTKKR